MGPTLTLGSTEVHKRRCSDIICNNLDDYEVRVGAVCKSKSCLRELFNSTPLSNLYAYIFLYTHLLPFLVSVVYPTFPFHQPVWAVYPRSDPSVATHHTQRTSPSPRLPLRNSQ